MNRSDKQKEIISDSDTTGNKNEPCPENETPCSEEPVQEKEDNKSVKETKVDKSNPDNENDSHASENGLIGKAFSSKTIKGMVGKEVTWAAIAAIGGAAIVIWNIIRYTFLLFSSYIMHLLTRVPIYLLMMRKNTSFTDGYIFYVTIIVLFLIANPVKYASMKSRILLRKVCSTIVFVMSVVFLLVLFTTPSAVSALFKLEVDGITSYKTMMWAKYYLSFYGPLVIAQYLIRESTNTIDMDEPVVQEEHIAESNKESKRKIQIKLFKRIKKFFDLFSPSSITNTAPRVFVSLLILTLILFNATLTTEGLLDQNSRFIVADLGEQYIVQTASYEQEEHTLILDTSRYFVIDSNKETVEVIKFSFLITPQKHKT